MPLMPLNLACLQCIVYILHMQCYVYVGVCGCIYYSDCFMLPCQQHALTAQCIVLPENYNNTN